MKNVFPAEFGEGGAMVEELSIAHTSLKRGKGFLAIPPESIVLSRGATVTSERNHFRGGIVSVERAGHVYNICVNCGNLDIISTVTRGALSELDLRNGQEVCLSFKASAVHVF
jgi:molybdopterin-binding protein